jgi:hypothetical protein
VALLEGVQMTEALLHKSFKAQGLEKWVTLLRVCDAPTLSELLVCVRARLTRVGGVRAVRQCVRTRAEAGLC